MDLMGMRGGTVRPPLRNLTDDARAEFHRTLEATGWLERLLGERSPGGGR
jgi:dihydrodipicolinate synthase/N-acetylneuraminate lyase